MRPGLDIDAWLRRAREHRFLEAYRAGLLERRVWVDIDPDLLHAFEVDKELYEFAYAATYLPAWLYAPTEGGCPVRGGSMTVDRVAALEADIRGGPHALADLLDAYAALDGPLAAVGDRPMEVVLTGLGSSLYAASTAAAHLRSAGLPAWAEYASTGLPTAASEHLTLVAISASGGTREVVEAARRHRGRGRVIAITNDPVEARRRGRPRPAVARRSGGRRIATRTFRATIVVLGLLAGRWLGGSPTAETLRPTVEALRAALDRRDEWLAAARTASTARPRSTWWVTRRMRRSFGRPR